MKTIISKTGKIHGRGSDKFKWVSGLTTEEREAVKRGDTVLIKDDNPHYTCSEYKEVYCYGNKYYHRNYKP